MLSGSTFLMYFDDLQCGLLFFVLGAFTFVFNIVTFWEDVPFREDKVLCTLLFLGLCNLEICVIQAWGIFLKYLCNHYLSSVFTLLPYWTELLLSSTESPDPLTFFFSIFCIYLWVFLLSGLSIESDAFRPSIEFLPYVFIFQELFVLPNLFKNDPFLNAVSSLKSLRILWF